MAVVGLILLVFPIILIATVKSRNQNTLLYVYQIVRNGARTPTTPGYTTGFPEPRGMLTPMGMRQRYLLGKYNEHKFQTDFYNSSKLNAKVWADGFSVTSTDVYRTIQSGYS